MVILTLAAFYYSDNTGEKNVKVAQHNRVQMYQVGGVVHKISAQEKPVVTHADTCTFKLHHSKLTIMTSS
jgi:hypothetical protein